MSSVIFRLVTSADEHGLSAFYERLSPETRAIFGTYPFTREQAAEIAMDNEKSLLKRHYVAVQLTAEGTEEMIIGLLWFWPWIKRVPWFGIMISDEYQSRGLGKRMLQFSIEEAQFHGKGGILLTTAKSNVRAQSLYKLYGFETIGEEPRGEHLMILNFDSK